MMTAHDKNSIERQLGWQEKELVRHELLEKLHQFKEQVMEKLSGFIHNLPEADITVVKDVFLIDCQEEGEEDDGYFCHEEWEDIVISFPYFAFYFKRTEMTWDSALCEYTEDYEYEEVKLENMCTPMLKAILDNIEKAFEDYVEYVSKFAQQLQEAKDAVSSVSELDKLHEFASNFDALVSAWQKRKKEIAEALREYLDSLPEMKFYLSYDPSLFVEFPTLRVLTSEKDKYGNTIYIEKHLEFSDLLNLKSYLPHDAYVKFLKESPEVPEWGIYPLQFELEDFERAVQEYCDKKTKTTQ